MGRNVYSNIMVLTEHTFNLKVLESKTAHPLEVKGYLPFNFRILLITNFEDMQSLIVILHDIAMLLRN